MSTGLESNELASNVFVLFCFVSISLVLFCCHSITHFESRQLGPQPKIEQTDSHRAAWFPSQKLQNLTIAVQRPTL